MTTTTLYFNDVKDPSTSSERYADDKAAARGKEAARRTEQLQVPTVYAGSYLISTLALVVPLFAIARRERDIGATKLTSELTYHALGYIEALWTSKGRGSVRYRGPRLTQAHQTLLLTLLKLRSEQPVSAPFEVEPRELLRVMGWSDSKARRARLRGILDDLTEARLRVWGPKQDEDTESLRTSLISSWQASATGAWTIELSAACAGLFSGYQTYLDVEVRQKLREGIATFMYGYIAANTGVLPSGDRIAYPFRMLHELSGSTAKDLGEFGDSVCNALDQLKLLGVVKSYKRENGAVTVHKK